MEAGAPDKPRRWIKWMFLFNLGAVGALLLCYLAIHTPPRSIGYLSLFGLAYPFILLFNVAFILFWGWRRRFRKMLISLIVVLIGWGHVSDLFQISTTGELEEGSRTLKVLTWNVHLFGLYDWEKNTAKRNKIFEVIRQQKADILCFQEFFRSSERGYFETRDTMLTFLPTKYYHERYTHAVNGKHYFGVALFSRFPFISKGHVPFESDVNNFCIYADVKIGSDTVRVYNAHLQSIRFQPEDHAFVEENRNNEELKTGVRRIARRLNIAFKKRQDQVDRLAEHIASCPYKVVLCGDFNDPPASYTYSTFTNLLEDSFAEAGNGLGQTYIGPYPSFRIDYVLHSDSLEALDYQTLPEELSDHHAVVVTLAL